MARARRGLVVLLLGVVWPAACSNGPAAAPLSATAQEVLARVDARLGEAGDPDPGEVVIPPGCRLEIQTDEYGFETEAVVCDTSSTTTTTVPEPEPATPPVSTSAPTTTPDSPTTTLPGASPPLEDWIGSAEARSLARHLRLVLVGQSGCDSPRDLIDLENLAAATPLEIRSQLQAAVSDLRRMADLCNRDPYGWQSALEDALDDLALVVDLLSEESNG